MNESIANKRYIQKIVALARFSGQYIERLWRIKINVSRFYDFIVPLFSSMFKTFIEAARQVASYSGTINRLSLSRIMFLPPFDFFFGEVAPSDEEVIPVEMGRANVSFLLNVSVARKTARRLTERVATKTSETALTITPLLFKAAVVEAGAREPTKIVSNIVADFQSRFESKIAPSIKSMTAALQNYSGQKILSASLLAISEPLITVPSRFESPPHQPLVAPPEKEVNQVALSERPISIGPAVTFYPYKEMKAEFVTAVSVPALRFGPKAARSFGFAIGLPNILAQREIPILTRSQAFPAMSAPIVEGLKSDIVDSLESVAKLPSLVFDQKSQILRSLPVFSLLSTPRRTPPRIEPTPRYTEATMLPSIFLRPTSSLIEVLPYLISWVYNVSKVQRGTTTSFSAVPTVASTAARIVSEILLQPMSTVEAPWSPITYEPRSTLSRSETEGKPIEVEAIKLHQIVTSLVSGLSQKYPFLPVGFEISKTLASTVELKETVPEETLPLVTVPEVKMSSKLPTVIALATTENLIAQRLQEESSMLIKGMHVSRSAPGEMLSELGVFSPAQTTRVNTIAAASALLPHHATPTQLAPPSVRPPYKPIQVRPTIQNTINLTIAAESTDADLRDLERKISRILSDQLRRHYGTTRI